MEGFHFHVEDHLNLIPSICQYFLDYGYFSTEDKDAICVGDKTIFLYMDDERLYLSNDKVFTHTSS